MIVIQKQVQESTECVLFDEPACLLHVIHRKATDELLIKNGALISFHSEEVIDNRLMMDGSTTTKAYQSSSISILRIC